jgi:shikimate dehydrogenase
VSEVYLFGHPVAHSLSPAMHNAAFRSLGLPHTYTALDVAPDGLVNVVTTLRHGDALGANVTIPHKEAAVRLVDEATELAHRIGAVNTILRRGARLIGDNSDKYGFEQAIANVPGGHARTAGSLFAMNTVLVLGAGGAARACILALLERENSVLVAARDRGRADAVARSLAPFGIGGRTVAVVPWPTSAVRVDGVVNATPLGLHGEDPLEGLALPPVVVDIVPTAVETPLVKRARAAENVTVVDGLAMLLHQAARSFELWTGVPAPLEVMRAALPRPA